MTPEEILLQAAEILAEHGWCQNIAHNNEGQHCAIGALFKAAGNETANHLMVWPAVEMLRGTLGVGDVANWNDAPGRTAEDVILAMKETAHHDA